MSSQGSISIVLDQLRSDDVTAVDKIFYRFFDRLKSVARKRISVRDRKVVDDEDLALWAIYTFQRCIRDGLYPQVRDRNDVWKFLVSILERKSVDHIRIQHAEKRGGGQIRAESFFERPEQQTRMLESVSADEVNFEVLVDFLDVIDAIVLRLDDPELGEILEARFAGHTIKEIAMRLGRSASSVDRKLRLVRKIILEDRDIGIGSATATNRSSEED